MPRPVKVVPAPSVVVQEVNVVPSDEPQKVFIRSSLVIGLISSPSPTVEVIENIDPSPVGTAVIDNVGFQFGSATQSQSVFIEMTVDSETPGDVFIVKLSNSSSGVIFAVITVQSA